MILNFHFLTLFPFEFIDQASLKLSNNPINLHYLYSYSNNWNYSNLNIIHIRICFIFSKQILFVFIFVSKLPFAPTLINLLSHKVKIKA